MSRPALKAGRCQCTACGLLFSSVREFDRHRAGGYAKPGEWKGERYCRTFKELNARGWQEDARGYLHQRRPERAPAVVSPQEKGKVGAATIAAHLQAET